MTTLTESCASTSEEESWSSRGNGALSMTGTDKYKGSGKWWDSKSERWRYIWNQNGTLKEVRPPGGGDFAFDALFTYDALGRRLSKDAIGITCWLWNGNVPLHEWTPSQRRNEQGDIEEYQKDLRTWLFEEESFVPLALF